MEDHEKRVREDLNYKETSRSEFIRDQSPVISEQKTQGSRRRLSLRFSDRSGVVV